MTLDDTPNHGTSSALLVEILRLWLHEMSHSIFTLHSIAHHLTETMATPEGRELTDRLTQETRRIDRSFRVISTAVRDWPDAELSHEFNVADSIQHVVETFSPAMEQVCASVLVSCHEHIRLYGAEDAFREILTCILLDLFREFYRNGEHKGTIRIDAQTGESDSVELVVATRTPQTMSTDAEASASKPDAGTSRPNRARSWLAFGQRMIAVCFGGNIEILRSPGTAFRLRFNNAERLP